MPYLLSSTAHGNREHLESRALAMGDGPQLRDFRAQASEAAMGTAIWAFKLRIFDKLGRIASAREISEHHPKRPATTPAQEWYVTSQGRHYAMRKAFEDYWTDGEKAVYFALLLDGLAPAGYGPYTLIVDPQHCPRPDVACFPGNTAERYAPTGVLDTALCRAEIAPWDSRGSLLAMKHGTNLSPLAAQWPTMVCNEDDFSEAVAIGVLPLDAIREVRVDEASHRRWRKLRVQKLNGVPLSEDEQIQVGMLDLLSSWKDRFGTPIVAV